MFKMVNIYSAMSNIKIIRICKTFLRNFEYFIYALYMHTKRYFPVIVFLNEMTFRYEILHNL
jgi:hypothetical protein